MPIYEYRCNQCGSEKEHLQKMNAAPLTDCPACGAGDYVKLVSAAGFQLKGSGWYATDFKNNGSPPKKSTDARASKGSGSASTTTPATSTNTTGSTSAAAPTAASSGCAGACACHPG